MSMDFLVLLASPKREIADVLISAEEKLFELGFWRDRIVDCRKLGQEMDHEESFEIRSLVLERQKLTEWNTIYTEFRSSELSIGLQVLMWSAGFLNCFISIDKRSFNRLFIENTADVFYSAVAAIANACDAAGGFGEVGLSYDSISPKEILQDFLSDPQNPDKSHNFVIFPSQRMSHEEIKKIASEKFTVHECQQYIILVDKEYIEICVESG